MVIRLPNGSRNEIFQMMKPRINLTLLAVGLALLTAGCSTPKYAAYDSTGSSTRSTFRSDAGLELLVDLYKNTAVALAGSSALEEIAATGQ